MPKVYAVLVHSLQSIERGILTEYIVVNVCADRWNIVEFYSNQLATVFCSPFAPSGFDLEPGPRLAERETFISDRLACHLSSPSHLPTVSQWASGATLAMGLQLASMSVGA